MVFRQAQGYLLMAWQEVLNVCIESQFAPMEQIVWALMNWLWGAERAAAFRRTTVIYHKCCVHDGRYSIGWWMCVHQYVCPREDCLSKTCWCDCICVSVCACVSMCFLSTDTVLHREPLKYLHDLIRINYILIHSFYSVIYFLWVCHLYFKCICYFITLVLFYFTNFILFLIIHYLNFCLCGFPIFLPMARREPVRMSLPATAVCNCCAHDKVLKSWSLSC